MSNKPKTESEPTSLEGWITKLEQDIRSYETQRQELAKALDLNTQNLSRLAGALALAKKLQGTNGKAADEKEHQ
jgi:hypothetical protein